MAALLTQPNFGHPGRQALNAYTPGDDFYEQLIHAHRGLSDAQSGRLNARLILLLANHIGDLQVLAQALDAARAGVVAPATVPAAVPAAVPSSVTAPAASPSPTPSPPSSPVIQESPR